MEMYYEKIRQLRKEKGLSVNGLCSLAKITRGTLWKWENGKQFPKIENIKNLAKALNVSVSEISDIIDNISYGKQNFTRVIDAWEVLASMNRSQQEDKYHQLLNSITSLNNDISQTKIIINALVSSVTSIFYIKDTSSNYIIASNSFLENLKLNSNFKVFGKNDKDFFSAKDAKKNTEEDHKVLNTGKSIIDIEDYIPGSRNKTWGLISKHPVFANDKKIIGILGIFHDITERKQAENKRKMLEGLLDYVPNIIGFSAEASKKRHLYFNKAIEKLGHSVDYFYKMGLDYVINTCMHPDDAIELKRIKFFTKKRKLFPSKHTFRLKINDQYRWYKQLNTHINYNNEWHEIGINSDCTEEKQLQTENEAHIEMLEEYLNKNQTIAWTANLKNGEPKLTYISKNIKQFTGYSQEDFFKPKTPCSFTLIYPENYPKEKRPSPKRSLLSIIHPDSRKKIARVLKKSSQRDLSLKIITAENKILEFKTTVFKKEMDGINTVYYGKANKK
jgi:PAS domain S-box-containing protein